MAIGGTYDPIQALVDVYRMVEVEVEAWVATKENKDGASAIFVFRVRWRMEVPIPPPHLSRGLRSVGLAISIACRV